MGVWGSWTRTHGDRLLAVAFVVMVTIGLAGIVSADTGANFTGATTNPNDHLATLTVQPPASQNAPTSSAGGVVNLSWTATPTAPGTHTLTYLVLRGPVGGPYAQITSVGGLAYTDTPPTDGTYQYVIQARVSGGGSFTSANSAAQNGVSDRIAPTMTVTCNGGSCAGWFKAAVTVTVSGTDGGVGMGSVTRNVDGGGQVSTTGASATFNVSGESSGHQVVYFGTDAAGNSSSAPTQLVRIDLTAPTTPGAFTAASGTCCGTPYDTRFSWTVATDALSGVASQTLHYVDMPSGSACPAIATTANFPSTVSVSATATGATVTGSAFGRTICGYVDSTDNAGNTSAPSAIKSAFAL